MNFRRFGRGRAGWQSASRLSEREKQDSIVGRGEEGREEGEGKEASGGGRVQGEGGFMYSLSPT